MLSVFQVFQESNHRCTVKAQRAGLLASWVVDLVLPSENGLEGIVFFVL